MNAVTCCKIRLILLLEHCTAMSWPHKGIAFKPSWYNMENDTDGC